MTPKAGRTSGGREDYLAILTDLDDGFGPPPPFKYVTPGYPSPEQAGLREFSRDEDEPVAPEPDLATPVGDSRQKAGSRSARKSKNDGQPLFLPDPESEGEQPEEPTSKQMNRKASIAWVGLVQDAEREEVEEKPPRRYGDGLRPACRRLQSVVDYGGA